MSEGIRIKSFSGLLANKPKTLSFVRCYTKEEFCKEVCPIIRQQIDRLLNPSDDDKERYKQLAEDLKESIFEWEIVGINVNE